MFCQEEKPCCGNKNFRCEGPFHLISKAPPTTTTTPTESHIYRLRWGWGWGGGGDTGKFFPRGHRIDAFDLWNISEEYRIVSVLLTVAGKRESTYLVCRGEGQGWSVAVKWNGPDLCCWHLLPDKYTRSSLSERPVVVTSHPLSDFNIC